MRSRLSRLGTTKGVVSGKIEWAIGRAERGWTVLASVSEIPLSDIEALDADDAVGEVVPGTDRDGRPYLIATTRDGPLTLGLASVSFETDDEVERALAILRRHGYQVDSFDDLVEALIQDALGDDDEGEEE
jgi:hypothetical protein